MGPGSIDDPKNLGTGRQAECRPRAFPRVQRRTVQRSVRRCDDAAGDGEKMFQGARCGIAEVPAGSAERAVTPCPVLARSETELERSAVRVFVNLDVASPGPLKSFLRKASKGCRSRDGDGVF